MKLKFMFIIPELLVATAVCLAQAPAQQPSPQSQPTALASDSQTAPSPSERGNGNDPSSGETEQQVETMFPHLSDTRFWLSGQANFIFQANPSFYAKYTGPHSLNPNFDHALSRVVTIFTGARLNSSTELLFDLEEAGGSALSAGLGLAGFTNLDIVRNPSLTKAPYPARAMIHKVFALSKDKVENERNPLSLFDELPRRRLEVRFGKFGMPDFIDVNSAGSDTHLQFMNWTVDNNGAWDYAADTRGYTVGGVVDYEDRNWGFRFAEGLMPKVANGIDLVWRPWQVHAENWEYELRHGVIPRKAGVVRLLAYTNYANMGIYRDAIAQFQGRLVPTPEITDHPWHITRKYGFGVNLEQNLARYVTAFGRFGWNNGKTESFAYTEVDQTFEGGLAANGALWHRRQDRTAVAVVTNGICKDHQTYLALGGEGFLLGDGALNYGRENIIEAYYTAHAWRGIYFGPDVQHINNPGYNRDRGPVLVGSFRLHLEF
jgi:high affinity Mn2+ porin